MKTVTAQACKSLPRPENHCRLALQLCAGWIFFATAWVHSAERGDLPFPVIERFESFDRANGIPADKVHAVLKTTDGQLWIGTWDGLCVRQSNGQFRRYGPEDGLSHKTVLCLVEDRTTGDLWVGTMRGLNKFSGGKFTRYTQTNSGLPNNVVYGVDLAGDTVWAATAAGTGALNLKTGAWKIYDHNNSIMHEPWCYSIKGAGDRVFIGVWGGGIVEHDPRNGSFKEYRDPDRDFHFDLVPDDGPINDITAWLAWNDGILWQCTYFGLSRYDGKFWKTWVQDKSPLPSNFTQFAWPVGSYCWIGHDRGASVTDGNHWVNYLIGDSGEGLVEIHRPDQRVQTQTMSTSLCNGFVLGIWADANEVWFATSRGLSRGVFGAPAPRPGIVRIPDESDAASASLATNGPLTPSLSPSEGERVPGGRVRGPFRGSQREPLRGILTPAVADVPGAYSEEERQYPYYGNTPDELLPYRGIEPHYRYWTTRFPFRGPGRDHPDPPGLASLKVGLLSPSAYGPEGARGQRSRRGVLLAFEEENAARQPGQLPFELIEREDAPQWGSAANIAVDFKDHEVLGYLGTIDGDATHVALRVSLKTETYIINTSDPDPSLTETQIPWLTRIFPDERQQCWRLAYLAVTERACKRIAILRESSRPGRMGVAHFINFIRRLGYPPVAHLLYEPGDRQFSAQLETIKNAEPDAVLFYGQPDDIGHAAALFRKEGIKAQFFGFDRLKEKSFIKAAGAAAEGAVITYFFDPDRTDPPWVEFVRRFQERWGESPDIYAAYGYDGAKMMIEAINHAGPNRFRVRDYLANLDEWTGVTGRMIFDGRWDNIVPISVAEYRDGRWHFRPSTAVQTPATGRP